MRATSSSNDLPGQDSFLDIVANMVGILIILVMVVGVRASRTPTLEPTEDDAVAEASAASPSPSSQDVESLYRETNELAEQVIAVEREVLMRHRERAELNLHVAALQEALQRAQTRLSRDDRQQLQLRTELDAAQRRFEELTMEQLTLDTEAAEVETIQSLPTPLAHTVRGSELHLRLSAGRVSVIPVDELLDALRQDAELNLWKLKDDDAASGTVGPIEGFRMRYRLAKGPYAARSASGQVERGTVIRLERWELLPGDADLGEAVEQALMPHSLLSEALGRADPQRTTITIWTYADSFSQFRALKKALFEQGFSTAGRPLPDGVRIAGSPNGSRSAAQ